MSNQLKAMLEPFRSSWLFLFVLTGIALGAHGQTRIVCSENDTLRTNLIPIGTSGNWTLLEGGGNIIWVDSSSTPVTNLANGTNVFVWSFEENGNLFSDTIRLDYQVLLADAGLDQALCANEATMQATPSPDGMGIWQLESGIGEVETPNSPTSRITQLGVGRNVFSWTVSNGICPTLYDTVTILNYGFVQAEAGIDQDICNDRTNIEGNLPAFSNGFWSAIHPEIVFENPLAASTFVYSLQPGTNWLIWTLEIGNCASSKDTLLIKTASPLFAAYAGLDQQICANKTTLHANRPLFGQGSWRVLTGNGVLLSPESHVTQVENLNIGLHEFEFSIQNPPCATQADTIQIEVLEPLAALNISPDTAICTNATTLRVLQGGTAGGIWSRMYGSGELVNPQETETLVQQLAPGLSVFRFQENQTGNCPGRFADILITRNLPPSPVQENQSILICADKGNLQAEQPLIGQGRWEIINGNIEVANEFDPTSAFDLTGNEAQLRWLVENENCAAGAMVVNVRSSRSASAAFAGFDVGICETSANLEGNFTDGLPGIWTVISGSGTIDNPNQNETRIRNLAVGKNTFRWHIDPINCPENFDEVSIIRFEPPEIPFAGADTQICTSTWRMSATEPIRGIGSWNLLSGTANILEPNNPSTWVEGIGPGPHEFAWTVVHGPCRAETSTFTILNNNIANLASTGGNRRICTDSTVLSGNFPLNGDGVWTRISGSGSILNPFLNQAIVTNLSIGENRFRWTIAVPDCPTTFADQVIFVAQPPNQAFAGTDKNVCGSAVLLEGNEVQSGTSNWRLLAGSGRIAPADRQQTWVFGLSPGQHVLEYRIENAPCPASKDTVELTVQPHEVRAYAGENQWLCIGQTVLQGQWPAIGSGRWELVKGAGQIVEPESPVSQIFQLAFGETQLIWRVQQDSCMAADLVSLYRRDSHFTLGADTFLCSGTSFTLRSPENFTQRRWNTGDTIQNISVNRSGWYILRANSPESCPVMDSIYLLFGTCQTLQVSQPEHAYFRLLAYPNPANESIQIRVDPWQPMFELCVFDMLGKQMLHKIFANHPQETQIPIHAFPNGLYMLKVTYGDKTLTGRFLKH